MKKTMYAAPLAREASQSLNAISDTQEGRERKGKGDSDSEGSLKGR